MLAAVCRAPCTFRESELSIEHKTTQGGLNLEPGCVLAGKYRIERVLGQGGMGVVLSAYHVQLEQRVAVKLMLPHATASDEAVARFLREARAAARISSEHVARVFDVGALETGEPYMAMEYLEGSDIAQLLAQRSRLPVEEAIDYLLQACEALAEAHAVGIVHRDLKPSNLFLVSRMDGRRFVKVLDFGISKMTGGSGPSSALSTVTSALMGSPLYMSPEQMSSSKNVTASTDVWALGVVLYELVSGKPPFNGDTLPQVCARVMSEPPPPLSGRAPGLPPALYEVVDRCLEKEPTARYPSVAELARALEPLASANARQSVERISHILNVRTVPSSAGVGSASGSASGSSSASVPRSTLQSAPFTPLPQSTHAAWGETHPPPVRRSTGRLVGAAVVVVALLATVLFFALRPTPGEGAVEAVGSPASAAASLPAGKIASTTAEPLPRAPVVAPAAPVLPMEAPADIPASTASSQPARKPTRRAPSRPAASPASQASPRPTATAVAPVAVPSTPALPPPPAPITTRSRL
jgi:serine/threonine protein kinase